MDRQQFDRRDAEPPQIVDDGGMAEPAECAAQRLRHVRMQLGEPARMKLVDDGAVPRHFRRAHLPPGEGGIDHPALHHQGRRVAVIKGLIIKALELVAEQLGPEFELADHRLGVRIKHQLVRIIAVALVGFVGAVHPIAVDRAGAGIGNEAVPDLVGVFGQLDAFDFLFAGIVEQAELDLGARSGEQREVHAQAGPCCPQGIRRSLPQPRPFRFANPTLSVPRARWNESHLLRHGRPLDAER